MNPIHDKPRIAISACLLGDKVRYDGGHKREPLFTDTLCRQVRWIKVCPEFEVGMGAPREPVQLSGRRAAPRMIGAVSGVDWTSRMKRFTAAKLRALEALEISGFILKSASPSCGIAGIPVHGNAVSRPGRGLFAAAVMKNWPLLPVADEAHLREPAAWENFIDRVFAYRRWRLEQGQKSAARLVDFHSRHELLLLAHSEPHYRRLRLLVARVGRLPLNGVYRDYGRLFMAGLAVPATAKKHAHALRHIAGCFPGADERKVMAQAIAALRAERTPLAEPLALARRYAEKFQVDYLLRQVYLRPDTGALALHRPAG